MNQVKTSITIDAAPQTVFDTVMDPQRLGDWVTIHRSVKVKSKDPTEKGAQMDQVLSLRGVSIKVHWTLSSVTCPEEAEWQGRGPAGSRALIRYRVEGPASGPTTFEYTNEFSAPGGAAGMAASKVLVGSASEREANRSLSKLKALLEG
jgi:carbon monoxide dehydrogenase subunit G